MNPDPSSKHLVAVIGAGPAGLYAAGELSKHNVHVVLFNRDIKPGGLAEYGIYPDKHRMKEGLRAQFFQILSAPQIDYFGNIQLGSQADLSIEQLCQMGFQAILVTVGAQDTKWLGLPGEKLAGVYHAKDLVFHYNLLPPYSQQPFRIGRKVAIVGMGNVMVDVAHYLMSHCQVDEVVALARRGPAEVKFDRCELENVAANLDMEDLQQQLKEATPLMQTLGESPGEAYDYIRSALPKAAPRQNDAHFILRFFLSPVGILGENGRVSGLEVEKNTLQSQNGQLKAVGTGERRVLDVDTVIFAIGDRVDEHLGLPLKGGEFVKAPNPLYPVDGNSFEVYDGRTGCPMEGIFLAGWARKASQGLVGVARRDGVNGAQAILQYLEKMPPLPESALTALQERLHQLHKPWITKADLWRLRDIEMAHAKELGTEEFKFATNEEMLAALGKS
ncbi:MAG: FAD-dependent oxidoreductase [Chloroflexi bacterium]|nr:FAD-dependent oxidoreductase [Chloroflexota bacterium]